MSNLDNKEQDEFDDFEVSLTPSQSKEFNDLLPGGYSFDEPKKVNTPNTPRSAKKYSINSVQEALQPASLQRKVSENTDPNNSATKRVLRDREKKKSPAQLEKKNSGIEGTGDSSPYKPPNEGVKKCYNLLQKLKKHKHAEPFLEPVDVIGLELEDYYDIIKEPMDISTVEEKLKGEKYNAVSQFASDIRKIWNNSFRYNEKGSEIYFMTVDMSEYFEELFIDIQDVEFNNTTVKDLEKKVEKLSKQLIELHNQASQPSRSPAADKGMSTEEKKILCQRIKNLPPEHLRGVWELVSEGLAQDGQNRERLEFDVNSLPQKLLKQLDKYVKQKMSQIKKDQSKSKGKSHSKKESSSASKSQTKTNGKVAGQVVHPGPVVMKAYPDYSSQNGNMGQQNTIEQQYDNYHQDVNEQANKEADGESSESSFISDSDSE